jgi:hypothetical protein
MQKSLDQMNLTVAPRHLAARLDVSLAGLIAILSSSWTAWASNGEEQKTDDAYARRRHASQHHGFCLNESRTPTGASKRLIGWEVVHRQRIRADCQKGMLEYNFRTIPVTSH